MNRIRKPNNQQDGHDQESELSAFKQGFFVPVHPILMLGGEIYILKI